MSEENLKYLFSPSKGILVAVNPHTGSAICFNQNDNKWVIAPRNYNQIIGDCMYNGDDFESITQEKAKTIYKEISPDEKLLNKY